MEEKLKWWIIREGTHKKTFLMVFPKLDCISLMFYLRSNPQFFTWRRHFFRLIDQKYDINKGRIYIFCFNTDSVMKTVSSVYPKVHK